jgi:hypothetical protein
MRSASTRFCARDATSTPDPALSDDKSFCAAALLAAWISAAVEVAVLVVELTGNIAMIFFGGSMSIVNDRRDPRFH